MCPNYALVEESVLPEFLEQLKLVSTSSLFFQVRHFGVHLTHYDLNLKLTPISNLREDLRL